MPAPSPHSVAGTARPGFAADRRPPAGRQDRVRAALVVGLGLVLPTAAACTAPNPAYQLASPGWSADGADGVADAAPSPDRRDGAGTDGPDPADAVDLAGSVDLADAAPDAAPPPDRSDGPGTDGPTDAADPTDAAGSVDLADTVNLVPMSRVLGHWRFDEPGGTRVADSSSAGNHGTVEGLDPATAWVAGHPGNALQFPVGAAASRPGVRVPWTEAIDNLTSFTVAAWIYRTSTVGTEQNTIISRQVGATSQEVFGLTCIGDDLLLYVATLPGDAPKVRASGAAPAGRWLHVAATFDGTTMTLYSDGAVQGTATSPRPLPRDPDPLYLGTNKNAGNDGSFAGLLDELVLFTAALPASAIADLYDGADPASL